MPNDIASLLANSAETGNKFDLFRTLIDSYRGGLDENYKRRTQDAFTGPDVLTDGKIDPAKMLDKAARVGGLQAAEHLKSLFDVGVLQDRQRAGEQVQRDRFGNPPPSPENPAPASPTSQFPASLNRQSSTAVAPDLTQQTPSRGPVQTRSLPPPPQAAGPFTQFLTAQGVPPDRQQDEAIKLQQGFMQATGRPFDTSKQLNLADNDTRQVLGAWVLNRADRGQQPQVAAATRLGPGVEPTAAGGAMAQGQSPIVPQQTAPQAPPPMQQVPPPVQQQAPAPQQMMPRPVQTESIQRPQAQPLVNEAMINSVVGPTELRRFGNWQNAYDYYQRALSQASGLPPTMQADMEKKVAAIRDLLKYTESERNAAASGQPSPMALDVNKAATTELNKQDIDVYNKRNAPIQAAAQISYDGIQKAKLMKQLTVDPNFYSGPLNQNVQTYNQFKAIFGQNPSSALPQEAFNKVTNDMLTEQIKSMGQSGVGRVLLSEVNSMKASVASLGITPQTNRALAEIIQRVYAKSQHIADIANSVPQVPGQMNRTLDTRVHEYLKQNPMFTADELKNPSLLGAPDTPPGSEKWSPAQARVWATRIGLKPGDPIRVDGTIRAVP